MNSGRSLAGSLLLLVVACSGGASTSSTTPAPTPTPTPTPDRPTRPGDDVVVPGPANPDPGPVPTPAPAVADRLPELFAPAQTKVGVGQAISFGVAAIDQDLDETRVEVVTKPASAVFDALTQTVTWTPTKAELGPARFELVASQPGKDGAFAPVARKAFEISVEPKKQPAPVAPRQGAVIETLLTIREPARLTRVNLDWPFDATLQKGAELLRATLPPEAQAKLPRIDRKALYRDFLTGLAQTHGNPTLDPASPRFDRVRYADPQAWKIVAVRPRVDKKWAELRIVYQNVKAPEPVFAMFRFRPSWDVPGLPPEAREQNNRAFYALVSQHLLDARGGADEALLADPKLHARRVSAFVRAVLTFNTTPPPPAGKKGAGAGALVAPVPPYLRAAFLALPTEARLGGGSARAADGSYRSGDGWAWSVMKPMPSPDGAAQRYVNIGIPGFWTEAVASPDGKAWVGKCAAKFDGDNPRHEPGYEVLCRKPQGFVDLPAVDGGKVTSSKIDAVNLFVRHKQVDAAAMLPLEDGRRDHGEENGMTCAQCHIRNFGVRDYHDPRTASPAAGAPTRANRPIATLNFQIVPSTTWEAYTLEFMRDQECKAKAAYEALGLPTALTCPLLAAK